MYGKHHTEEAIEKIRKKNLGRKLPRDIIERIAKLKIGKKRSKETKEKISKARCKYFYGLKSPEGAVYITDNTNKFCKENNNVNLKPQTIRYAARNSGRCGEWHIIRALK